NGNCLAKVLLIKNFGKKLLI
ncbi:Hypothetical protein SRAE_0000071400, partial [Strongyloides ratti]